MLGTVLDTCWAERPERSPHPSEAAIHFTSDESKTQISGDVPTPHIPPGQSQDMKLVLITKSAPQTPILGCTAWSWVLPASGDVGSSRVTSVLYGTPERSSMSGPFFSSFCTYCLSLQIQPWLPPSPGRDGPKAAASSSPSLATSGKGIFETRTF